MMCKCRKYRQKRYLYLVMFMVVTVCFIITLNYHKPYANTDDALLPNIQRNPDAVLQKQRQSTSARSVKMINRNDKANASPFIDPIFHMNLSADVGKHIILHWNSPDWLTRWSRSVDMSWCTYINCLVSFDQSVFNQSSAVVFNLPNQGMGNKPPVDPDHRNPNQIWTFFTLESPENIPTINEVKTNWQNVFNWSWTYKPESDIFHPYGVMISRKTIPKRNYTDIFRQKKKFAAWVVSHCKTPSKREDFVKILQKYVDVDIYGGCGTKAPSELESFLSTNYKFYLGFENSFCEDYMTEKLFHYYMLDLITVLRGSNKYISYLPEGSFIDTANFSSISALAKYLKSLADNEEEYVKYLKIKDKFDVYEREFMYKEALCNMCEKLNNLDKYRRVYSDITEWLGQCNHDVQDLI